MATEARNRVKGSTFLKTVLAIAISAGAVLTGLETGKNIKRNNIENHQVHKKAQSEQAPDYQIKAQLPTDAEVYTYTSFFSSRTGSRIDYLEQVLRNIDCETSELELDLQIAKIAKDYISSFKNKTPTKREIQELKTQEEMLERLRLRTLVRHDSYDSLKDYQRKDLESLMKELDFHQEGRTLLRDSELAELRKAKQDSPEYHASCLFKKITGKKMPNPEQKPSPETEILIRDLAYARQVSKILFESLPQESIPEIARAYAFQIAAGHFEENKELAKQMKFYNLINMKHLIEAYFNEGERKYGEAAAIADATINYLGDPVSAFNYLSSDSSSELKMLQIVESNKKKYLRNKELIQKVKSGNERNKNLNEELSRVLSARFPISLKK